MCFAMVLYAPSVVQEVSGAGGSNQNRARRKVEGKRVIVAWTGGWRRKGRLLRAACGSVRVLQAEGNPSRDRAFLGARAHWKAPFPRGHGSNRTRSLYVVGGRTGR